MVKPGARTTCFIAGEAARIKCDINKAHNEAVSESVQRLILSKWNLEKEHSEGSWHFDTEAQ